MTHLIFISIVSKKHFSKKTSVENSTIVYVLRSYFESDKWNLISIGKLLNVYYAKQISIVTGTKRLANSSSAIYTMKPFPFFAHVIIYRRELQKKKVDRASFKSCKKAY